MFEKFLKQAEEIVAQHKAQYTGVFEMKGGVIGDIEKAGKSVVHGIESGWNDIRDTAETAASLVGNYFLPGSSLLTDQLVSQGSKKQLSSPLGLIGQAGTGLAGAGVGSSVTGISSAADNGAGWGNLASGLSNTASSAGNALGLTDAAGEAAPWVDPDIAAAASGGTGAADAATTATAQPWVNPDVAPGSAPDIASLNAIEPGAAAPTANNITAAANPGGLSSGESNLLNQATTASNAPIGSAELSSLAGSVPAAAGGAGTASSLLKSVTGNLGPIVTGAGLAANLLGQKAPAVSEGQAESALGSQATQAASSGQQLQNYLPSGTLPPGAQAGIDQAKNSAKASIRSKYASMGMSGSSSEQQELAAVDANAQAQGEQQALQLLNSGISESQLSGSLYQSILNGQLQQDQALSSSIGNFASSLAGGSSGTTKQ